MLCVLSGPALLFKGQLSLLLRPQSYSKLQTR